MMNIEPLEQEDVESWIDGLELSIENIEWDLEQKKEAELKDSIRHGQRKYYDE